MKKLLILPILLLLFIATSCSSGSDDDIIIIPPADVTYAGTVKAIIDGACLNCHTSPPVNGAPMSLLTLANVQEAVQNRGLVGRVESGSMPPSGADLTAAQVQAIKDWETGGFKP